MRSLFLPKCQPKNTRISALPSNKLPELSGQTPLTQKLGDEWEFKHSLSDMYYLLSLRELQLLKHLLTILCRLNGRYELPLLSIPQDTWSSIDTREVLLSIDRNLLFMHTFCIKFLWSHKEIKILMRLWSGFGSIVKTWKSSRAKKVVVLPLVKS